MQINTGCIYKGYIASEVPEFIEVYTKAYRI